MDITLFPNDVFLLIVAYLSPLDVVLCRRVSKAFNAAFTESELNRHVLLSHYPRAREVRRIVDAVDVDWSGMFPRVAARYHRLRSGKPRSIERLSLERSFVVSKWARYYPVAVWQRELEFDIMTAPFHYPDTQWTFDDGILIFPSVKTKRYELYDIGAGTMTAIDFMHESKIVRRIRLKDKVLIVEWCEQDPYHQLNETEMVFRHFATAFDIIQKTTGVWRSRFRNEWRIHFLGMPLNSRDCFISTHNASHYALYLWQPNRSSWGEDDPIEALAIWDISESSPYRPSEDPSGEAKPVIEKGARVVKRLSFADLDFYKIRQRSTPVISHLELDDLNIYVIEEDHRWLVGQQASHNLPRRHMVKSIGIPFAVGPRWEDECGADGDADLSYCGRTSYERSPGIAPCWRHEEFPYLTISEAVDTQAGVKFSARYCFKLETISIRLDTNIRTKCPDYEIFLRDDLWLQLLGKGKICGDERFLIGESVDQEIVILHFDGGH